MRRSFSNKLPGFSSKALLLLVLVASGGGLCYLALGQTQDIRGTEITGVIGARHHHGPMAFSPDGKTLALPKAAEGLVELWSLETGKGQALASSFNKDGAAARHVAFSKDGRLLAVDYEYAGVTLWDLPAKKERAHIPVSRPIFVRDMAFTEGDRTLVTVMEKFEGLESQPGPERWDCFAVRWEVSTGKRREAHVFDPTLQFKALSPDGRYAVLQNEEGQTVFDLATGKKAFAIDSNGGFIFSDDGSTLVSYHGDEITLWDVPSGRESRRFAFEPGYPGDTGRLSLSPDKKVLAVGGFTRSHVVGLISPGSGKVLGTFECCPPSMDCEVVRFSPDGRTLATDTFTANHSDQGVDPLLRLWRIPASAVTRAPASACPLGKPGVADAVRPG
jgi:WD40 repeat protein